MKNLLFILVLIITGCTKKSDDSLKGLLISTEWIHTNPNSNERYYEIVIGSKDTVEIQTIIVDSITYFICRNLNDSLGAKNVISLKLLRTDSTETGKNIYSLDKYHLSAVTGDVGLPVF